MKLLWTLAALAAWTFPLHGEVLRVCGRSNPPFLYSQDGGPAGLEHDLLASFAAREGLELEVLWSGSFEESFTLLDEGRCETVASIVTRTPERQERMEFSVAYFPVRVVMVSRDGAVAKGLTSMAGLTFATIKGTTYDRLLGSIEGVAVRFVATERAMFEAVAAGEAEALACDSAIVLPFLEEFPELRIVKPMSELQELAFPFRRGSPWRPKLDRHLQELKANGTYRALLEKHFGAEGAATILDPG